MLILDTDHFSVVVDRRHRMHGRLLAELAATTDEVAVSVITLEEQLRAWLAAVRRSHKVRDQIAPYDRLLQVLDHTSEWETIRFGEPAAEIFELLRKAKVRIGTQDLKIASICLAQDAILLSANLRDFEQVPGLRIENWLHA